MLASEVNVELFQGRGGLWFCKVEAPGFQATEAEGASNTGDAMVNLIQQLVVQVHERNVKIKEQRDTIDSFAAHKLAISQYGPQSPASTAKVRDPETGEWVDASEQDERDSGGAEVDKGATPTSG